MNSGPYAPRLNLEILRKMAKKYTQTGFQAMGRFNKIISVDTVEHGEVYDRSSRKGDN
jgi:hypothetical protein